MDKKPMVKVTYGGEVLKSMRFPGEEHEAVDLRWNPFLLTNEERAGAEVVIVKVENWVMTQRFRGMVHQDRFYRERFFEASDVNAYLTILSHFGFDADYNRDFVRRIEPMIAEVMLHAYYATPAERITPRIFHGEMFQRGKFFEKFERFLVKYGM